jgi:flagellar protein FliO/FliZ
MKIKNIRTISGPAIFFLLLLQVNKVTAGDSLPTKTPMDDVGVITKDTTSMPVLLLQTVLILVVLVAFIYFLLRFVGRRSQAFFGRAGIRMLGGCSLGPQKSLQIVQIGSALYVVGVGENVTLLRCIENPEEISDLLETLDSRMSSSAPNTVLFGEWAKKIVKKDSVDKEDMAAAFQVKVEEARKRRESMEKELFAYGEKEDER